MILVKLLGEESFSESKVKARPNVFFIYRKGSGNEIRLEQGPLFARQQGLNFFLLVYQIVSLMIFVISKDALPFLAEDFLSFVLHDGWLSSIDRQAPATKMEMH